MVYHGPHRCEILKGKTGFSTTSPRSLYLPPAATTVGLTAVTTPTTKDATSTLLLKLLTALRMSQAVAPDASPDKSEESNPKISLFERSLLKKLYKQRDDCNNALLPAWYQQLLQKHQDKKDKDHIVAALLSKPVVSMMMISPYILTSRR